MAYYSTTVAQTAVEVVGSFLAAKRGAIALSGGTITVTIPDAKGVVQVLVSPRSANHAYCSAHSGNTFTITGTSSDVVDYIAFCTGVA